MVNAIVEEATIKIQYDLQNALQGVIEENGEAAQAADLCLADLSFMLGSAFASTIYNLVHEEPESYESLLHDITAAFNAGYVEKAELMSTNMESDRLIKFNAPNIYVN